MICASLAQQVRDILSTTASSEARPCGQDRMSLNTGLIKFCVVLKHVLCILCIVSIEMDGSLGMLVGRSGAGARSYVSEKPRHDISTRTGHGESWQRSCRDSCSSTGTNSECSTLPPGDSYKRYNPFIPRMSDVPMFEALWDKSELDMSDVYGTYTLSSLQHAAVVVGGVVRAVATSVAAVVGG
jgi:hypothetical protein